MLSHIWYGIFFAYITLTTEIVVNLFVTKYVAGKTSYSSVVYKNSYCL